MDRKYVITNQIQVIVDDATGKDIILHRIKAAKDFNNIKKGDLGGYVASKNNLSQEGSSWIYDNAIVYGSAFIADDAKIFGDSEICGQTIIAGTLEIYDEYISDQMLTM